ncbi:MAG: precorrin-4 C(11)-methyltransferase [Clostridiales bacterium]|jgi:precorrin-4/cobalt-precorrin-4 C11-methyltransferase|nr:precorrin-4 C(11)-methyltransferase [Eubacteriales bacterium]MDH7565728.1 precorrin-4 C(11)-methyltransferase [Clostridiales bacterium]
MVYFIGAGPGDPELITVKGQRLLGEADIIIYAGSLVNKELLKPAKSGCKIYNSAQMTLEEVIAVMEEGEREGKMTVRLHTGDPSIYGAIREQMDELDKRGIHYEVVPGVSSFCAAAAALKKEYTLPGVTQTIILTRMEGRTEVPDRESIQALASHKATMIIFLSVQMIDELVKRLQAGYGEDTPIAVVYKASWPEQKVIRGTLGNISALVGRENVRKTALIVVGGFLGNDYELSRLYDKTFSHEYRSAAE